MKYECDLIKDLLPLYQDKTASQPSVKAVEEHLKECGECHRFYEDLQATQDMPIKSASPEDGTDGYLSLAKRLRRTKWYWRLCVGLIMGVVIYASLMYSDGNRFDPMKAAYASHIVDGHQEPAATVSMGGERMLYIFDDHGTYQNIDVTYRFPYWKYVPVWPNNYMADPDAGVQLITGKTYANSINNSLYVVYAVAVSDAKVAYIELGKKGSVQRQDIDSKVAVFYWDETGNWDGTDTWDGMIKTGELTGTAYANDGSVLYRLTFTSEPNQQNSYQWIPAA